MIRVWGLVFVYSFEFLRETTSRVVLNRASLCLFV